MSSSYDDPDLINADEFAHGRTRTFSNLGGDGARDDDNDPRRFSVDADTPLAPEETPAQAIQTILDCFTPEELEDLGIGIDKHDDHHYYYYDNTNPALPPLARVAVNPGSRLMTLSLSKEALDKPGFIDKMAAATRNRQFVVKNCDSLETARKLIAKYGDKLVFDDKNNPIIDGFKTDLPNVKFLSDAPHQASRPGHIS